MSKHPAILPVAATVLLFLAAGACATKDDVEALRSDVAALQDSTESAMAAHAAGAGPEYQRLRSDIAALQDSIRSAEATRDAGATAAPAEYRELRSDIAALRASIESEGTNRAGVAARKGPPPPEYQKVSTLAELPEFIPGLGTLYVRPQTMPAGPYLGYDRGNRLVNTIYMIPVADFNARKQFEELAVGGGDVQEVDFYYTPGHPGIEQPHYHVVLWHVPVETAELR
jgi:ElaB/YqjD/DUF883 family membrane-anchored ribosome-binding protein